MRALYQVVNGVLYRHNEQAALLEDEAAPPLYLRFAFQELYGEARILPALLLDDWGREIKGLALYEWVRQYGFQFPRAELFGFHPDGREAQYFLRDLELNGRLAGYAYREQRAELATGCLLTAVLLPGENETPQRVKRPPAVSGPLRYARVSWWQIDPASPRLSPADLSFLAGGPAV